MDITFIFKSKLEFVRNRDKALGPENGENTNITVTSSKSKIFPGRKSEYHNRARDITITITSLRDFLKENRTCYLNINHEKGNQIFLQKTSSDTISDEDRDQIDSNVQKIIQNCQKRIFEYEKYVCSKENMQQEHPQLLIHLESVITSITDYLKDICNFYSEMRAIRVKRTVDLKSLSRLANTTSSSASTIASSSFTIKKKDLTTASSSTKTTNNNNNKTLTNSEPSNNVPEYFESEELSPEEMQMFEEENANLMRELYSISDEVEQIQSSVIQIAQLQEIFTEKVLQQEKEIDKISNLVVGSTENIRDGNEQVRQAIQKNADFRVWVLFFIVVMSFSLLFLDWYND